MIGVYEIRASSPFQPMCSISWLVLITYLPNFCMVSQTQSYTIAWPPWSYIHFFFIFHWFSNTCSCYLHSDDRYQTVRISSSLIDFYFIVFGTHMDISPTFLSLLFARSWHSFGTYSHFLFDILLRGSIYYKTPHTTLE